MFRPQSLAEISAYLDPLKAAMPSLDGQYYLLCMEGAELSGTSDGYVSAILARSLEAVKLSYIRTLEAGEPYGPSPNSLFRISVVKPGDAFVDQVREQTEFYLRNVVQDYARNAIVLQISKSGTIPWYAKYCNDYKPGLHAKLLHAEHRDCQNCLNGAAGLGQFGLDPDKYDSFLARQWDSIYRSRFQLASGRFAIDVPEQTTRARPADVGRDIYCVKRWGIQYGTFTSGPGVASDWYTPVMFYCHLDETIAPDEFAALYKEHCESRTTSSSIVLPMKLMSRPDNEYIESKLPNTDRIVIGPPQMDKL